LHVLYGRGVLPRSFLPTYYVPLDDVRPAALVDPVEAEPGLTVWAVAGAGPHKRVDVVASSRAVRVEIDGLLA
jgi:uncharacterized protein (DUF427 family)